jgi:hypothetical protein
VISSPSRDKGRARYAGTQMLTGCKNKERTYEDYARLVERSGWRIQEMISPRGCLTQVLDLRHMETVSFGAHKWKSPQWIRWRHFSHRCEASVRKCWKCILSQSRKKIFLLLMFEGRISEFIVLCLSRQDSQAVFCAASTACHQHQRLTT